ncbi:MAG: exopolysaccharide production protein ExoQ, partial [Pirellulaceae bacterium]
GAVLVLMPGKYKISLDSMLGLLVIVFYTYAILSVTWSDAPERSIRRLAAIILLLAAMMAVVRHLSMRDLIVGTVLTASSFIAIGVLAEIVHKTFMPWDLSYRFSGTAHPNTQGAYCAFCAIACLYAWRTSKSKLSIGWLVIGAVAVVFLVLTKSRSNLLGFIFGLGICWYITTAPQKRLLANFGIPLALASGLLLASFLGIGLADKLDDAASGIGRGESSVVSLSGRVPLWKNLTRYAGKRLFLGYGYDGFWTPERIAQISYEEGWTVPSAHSVAMEIQLSLGLIGLTLFTAVMALATWQCANELVVRKAVIYGFPFCLIVFGFVSGIFESGFAQPSSFDSFTAACSIALVAFRRRHSEDGNEEQKETRQFKVDRRDAISQTRQTAAPASWKTEEWKVEEYRDSSAARKASWKASWMNDDVDDDWGIRKS